MQLQSLQGLVKKYDYIVDCAKTDGNCFFHCIAKTLYGTENLHTDIRSFIVDLMEEFEDVMSSYIDITLVKTRKKNENDQAEAVKSHFFIRDMTWATQAEIFGTATLLGREIYILTPVDANAEITSGFVFNRCRYSQDVLRHYCINDSTVH